MNAFDPAAFTALLALVGLVILAAGLMSGALERTGVPAVAAFLLIGTVLGPNGLGLLDFGLDSPVLAGISILSLVLVLFTDAVAIDVKSIRAHARIAAIVLGPGTLLAAGLTFLAAWKLLEMPPAAAAILGAALASTDPVMMRGLLRLPEVGASARFPLRLESGLNDVVVLPIVLLAMVFRAAGGGAPASEVGDVALSVLLLGPLAGAVVGWLGVKAMAWVRGWMPMRRDYESLYVLGLAFTAYAAAEALHGSGFMAAFAAGLMVASIDVELCDCFKDYGEATAEMLLLLSFIAFGASLIWTGLEVFDGPHLAVAAVALLGRSLVLWVLLPRTMDPVARRLVVWFGPRALSSFLLVLLPVFAGIPGAAALFPVTALVVMLSVVGHGAMLAWATHRLERRRDTDTEVTGLPGSSIVGHPELITYEELARLEAAGAPVVLLDVRSDSGYAASPLTAKGAIRVSPNNPVESAAALALPRESWLVAYCS